LSFGRLHDRLQNFFKAIDILLGDPSFHRVAPIRRKGASVVRGERKMSLCHQTEKAATGDVSYMALFDLLTSLSSVASVRGAKFSPLAAERSGKVAQGGV
jgi:hypothetical protein